MDDAAPRPTTRTCSSTSTVPSPRSPSTGPNSSTPEHRAARRPVRRAARRSTPATTCGSIRLRGAGRAFCPGYDLVATVDVLAGCPGTDGEGRRDGRHGRVVDRPRPRVAARDDRALAVDVELPQADHRPDPRLLPLGRPRPDRRLRHRVRRRGHAVRPSGGARHGHPGDDRDDADASIGAAATKELLFTGDRSTPPRPSGIGLVPTSCRPTSSTRRVSASANAWRSTPSTCCPCTST